jgi:cytidylate kinase
MIITIGGNIGAGKTTLAARLSRALGYEELYIGGGMRDMAAEREIPIEEFYEKLKDEPDLERSVDDRQKRMMHEKENLIVQGRIAWFFAKESPFKVFNVFLGVSPEVGAQRSLKRPENVGRTQNEMVKANAERAELELERYRTLYDIENFLDPKHYDFILDSTNLTEDEVLQKILHAIA